jgi:hypothetical protein
MGEAFDARDDMSSTVLGLSSRLGLWKSSGRVLWYMIDELCV